jgi:hypothetical protein
MLIRLTNLELIEYPDELGALVMADLMRTDSEPFSLEEINLIVNGVLVPLYDEALTLEENISYAKEHCILTGMPDAATMQKGYEQIKRYNEDMLVEQIGYSSQELISEYYCTQPGKKSETYTIDQNLHEIEPTPLLTAPQSTTDQ